MIPKAPFLIYHNLPINTKKQASGECLHNKEINCLKAIVKKQLELLRELRNPLNSNYHNILDNTIIKNLKQVFSKIFQSNSLRRFIIM